MYGLSMLQALVVALVAVAVGVRPAVLRPRRRASTRCRAQRRLPVASHEAFASYQLAMYRGSAPTLFGHS